MSYLLIVSLIWAFSFGLIKGNLAGLDPSFVAFVRMALSLLFFAPMLRFRGLRGSLVARLMVIGAVQYGVMYVLYIAAYAHLAAHQVALFTVLTPLFVVAFDDIAQRKFRPKFALAALLAVAGAAIIAASSMEPVAVVQGFLLVQAANACFALGQVWYRRLHRAGSPHHATFGWMYLGAVLVTGASTLLSASDLTPSLSFTQVWTLGYLGIVASGVCFYLWNVGATRTNAGVLGVFNNAKVPLAVLVSLVVFGEPADPYRLVLGGGLIAGAVWVGKRVAVPTG